MNNSEQPGRGIFHWAVLSVVSVFVFLKWGFPYAAQIISGSENPLSVPSALMTIFMILTLISALVYLSISDERLNEFKLPVSDLMRGRPSEKRGSKVVAGTIVILAAILVERWIADGISTDVLVALFALLVAFATLMTGLTFRLARNGILIALPLLAGWVAYSNSVVTLKTPTVLRIQHPTMPARYERLRNPFRNVDAETRAKYVEEGRILYQINCRACHGTKGDGDGPMARGFRLKPANFRDPGTIATVVEAYTFWRIREGGPGLPREASPWDSAMPAWKDELSDEQIWKVIMAEYETADVEPRKLEKIE